jgi:ubiquinone/menaquinone biosynthesis C-methylase UbiE
MKKRVLESRIWDLNICCGKTDGGGINADIVRHKSVPNFYQLDDIYNLPFRDNHFGTVLCSHTIEHVDDPGKFYYELTRVGKEVKIVVPPLWDITAAFNVLEHKWIFVTFNKEHTTLPVYKRLPLSDYIQRTFGQRIKA